MLVLEDFVRTTGKSSQSFKPAGPEPCWGCGQDHTPQFSHFSENGAPERVTQVNRINKMKCLTPPEAATQKRGLRADLANISPPFSRWISEVEGHHRNICGIR
jgi:hypothetical protein